jgi:Rho GDP-dissociation inhibitor
MLARTGTYNVRSRVVDDDGEVYAGAIRPTSMPVVKLMSLIDWEWSFKLTKEW